MTEWVGLAAFAFLGYGAAAVYFFIGRHLLKNRGYPFSRNTHPLGIGSPSRHRLKGLPVRLVGLLAMAPLPVVTAAALAELAWLVWTGQSLFGERGARGLGFVFIGAASSACVAVIAVLSRIVEALFGD